MATPMRFPCALVAAASLLSAAPCVDARRVLEGDVAAAEAQEAQDLRPVAFAGVLANLRAHPHATGAFGLREPMSQLDARVARRSVGDPDSEATRVGDADSEDPNIGEPVSEEPAKKKRSKPETRLYHWYNDRVKDFFELYPLRAEDVSDEDVSKIMSMMKSVQSTHFHFDPSSRDLPLGSGLGPMDWHIDFQVSSSSVNCKITTVGEGGKSATSTVPLSVVFLEKKFEGLGAEVANEDSSLSSIFYVFRDTGGLWTTTDVRWVRQGKVWFWHNWHIPRSDVPRLSGPTQAEMTEAEGTETETAVTESG